MTAPNLELWDSTGSSQVTSFAFGTVDPGATSATNTYRVYNDKNLDGRPTAFGPLLRVYARAQGDTGPYLEEGMKLLDRRGVEIAITGGTAQGVTVTGFVGVGDDSWVELPNIQSGKYVEIQVRARLTASESGDYDISFEAEVSDGETIEAAAAQLFGSGAIVEDARDWIGLEYVSERTAPSGPPDSFVTVPDMWGRTGAGVMSVALGGSVELTNLDGDSAALGAGEAYYAVLGVGGVVKGSKATAPLGEADIPSVDDDFLPRALVSRDDSGTIDAADITEPWTVYGWAVVETDGLDITLGGGRGLVGNLVRRETVEATLTVTDDATTTVYLTQSGLELDSTAVDAEPLYTVTAASGSITGAVPAMRYSARKRRQVVAMVDAVTTGTEVRLAGPCRVVPDRFSIELVESSGTISSGQWKVELFARSSAGDTTLFTSKGTDDRRPVLAFGASPGDSASGIPEAVNVPAGSALFARVVEVPATPTTATIAVLAEVEE